MSKKSRKSLGKAAIIVSGCVILVMSLIVSCSKEADETGNQQVQVEITSFPSTINFNCTESPVYEDTILCAKWRGPNNDYIARPLNRPPRGKYYSWPSGLQIDVNTGAINVTQSEGGMQYLVGFVKEGTRDTCHSRIIISGVHYKDKVYILERNDTLAIPYFNANPLIQAICDISGDDDYPGNNNGSPNGDLTGSTRCEFDDDEDDDNGNGTADEPPPGQQANDKFIRVRTKSGIINLKKSLEDGAFGPDPQNGATTNARIYYRLNDCSQKALRSIKVRLIYFDKKSDIPPSLLQEVVAKQYNFESYQLISTDCAPRPPLIIVTRSEL